VQLQRPSCRYNDAAPRPNDKGGLDPTANSKWRNWADNYTGHRRRLREEDAEGVPRHELQVADAGEGPEGRPHEQVPHLHGPEHLTEFEDLTTKANENLGSDLDKFHGVTTFRRVPVLYTPQIDADADGVIYGVNHAKFYPIVLDGDWMREGEPMMDVEQHNVITTFIDGSYQYFCTNIREGGFVLSKVLAA
jgi:hypothetical protein